MLASHKATFHTPFTSLGMTPEACSSHTFPERMGLAVASEVLLEGRKLSAAEAASLGLVSSLVEDGAFESELRRRATALAALPPGAVQQSKAVVVAGRTELLERVNRHECEVLKQRWLSEECMRAVMKFMT